MVDIAIDWVSKLIVVRFHHIMHIVMIDLPVDRATVLLSNCSGSNGISISNSSSSSSSCSSSSRSSSSSTRNSRRRGLWKIRNLSRTEYCNRL